MNAHRPRSTARGRMTTAPGRRTVQGTLPGPLPPGGPMPTSCAPAWESSRVRSSRQRRRVVCRFAQADRVGLKAIRETAPR
jgi:hypothetical protein